MESTAFGESDLFGKKSRLFNAESSFSIYLTDATPDNIVVDRETLQVAFVDLDSLQLVDSSAFPVESKIHRHEKIDCDRCFAYVPDELCSHRLSDINLFSVCQVILV